MSPKRDARLVSDLIQEAGRAIGASLRSVGTTERQVGEVTRQLQDSHR